MLIVLVHSLLLLSLMISVAKVTIKTFKLLHFYDFFAIKIQIHSIKGRNIYILRLPYSRFSKQRDINTGIVL